MGCSSSLVSLVLRTQRAERAVNVPAMVSTANPEQAKYWNEHAGAEWVALQDRMDRQLGPLGDAALEAAAPQPGDAVLDVGCGCGATTLQLAAAVGNGGSVHGLDISGHMTAVAASRAAEAGLGNTTFTTADAQDAALAADAYDLIFSRFGVMFFADPVAAFSNLLSAARPGGRLAFVCWQKPADNAWSAVAGRAVMSVLPPQPVPDPLAPGPFAFADPERIRSILTRAGWSNIATDPCVRSLQMGGSANFDEVVDVSMRIGPASRALVGAEPELRSLVVEAIRAALEPHRTPAGVFLSGVCWIATARRAD